ncbi:MAG: CDP-alcohol phosphatidyltransferase family protein [Verrucomicrobia bacterium]|nr:CDP-alcohol phosphatidyltransferase family protein [Verrucomicrobiota bacterium]
MLTIPADGMTLANRITLARIGLIPLFGGFAGAYSRSVSAGKPDERLRRLATAAFFFATLTDGVDGFVARRFDQKSRLGMILDPIADKGLMLIALLTLGLGRWNEGFPAWFPAVVLGRESLVVSGYWALKERRGGVEVKPSPAGKAATLFQLLSMLAVLLGIRKSTVRLLVTTASALTVASGLGYLYDAWKKAGNPTAR